MSGLGLRQLPASGQPRSAPGGRLLFLDLIRGIAILGVMLWHLRQLAWTRPIIHYYPTFIIPYLDQPSVRGLVSFDSPREWLLAPLAAVANLGYQGVHLFLAASGFALSLSWARIAEGQRETPFARLYGRWVAQRGWRLLPPLWIALATVLVALCLFGSRAVYEAPTFSDDPAEWWRLTWLTALGQNGLSDRTFWSTNVPLWYVTILVQFSVVFPLLHALLRRCGPAAFMTLMATLTAASRWAAIDPPLPGHHYLAFGGFFGCRSVEFGVGMVVARRLLDSGELWRPGRAVMLCGAFGYAVGLLLAGIPWGSLAADAVIGAGLFLMLYGLAVRLERTRCLAWHVLALLGACSYGIFLTHFPLQHPLSRLYRSLAPGNGTIVLLAVAVLVLSTSAGVGIAYESLVNRAVALLRRGRFPRRLTRCA